MDTEKSAADEFAAIKKVHDELEPLSPEARSRVLNYLVNLLEIDLQGALPKVAHADTSSSKAGAEDAPGEFDSFAELFDSAEPSTNADKALVAGYWLQNFEGHEAFDSQSANSLLKNLGHGLANVTAALTSLKEQKPALVLQLKKSGSSQQSRKTYKVTVAGSNAIKNMIGESGAA
ncbi:MAG: hypothetical protein AAGF15_02820 [Pseudomonadota bacterium]